MTTTKGIFISFEGGDGSGKTTQIKLLKNWLSNVWHGEVIEFREPGGTHGGEAIRKLLVSENGNDWDSLSEALLMTAARRENVLGIIKPALERGDAVLSDRFFDSTLAYQSSAGGADSDLVAKLNTDFLDGIRPDITILLDIDPEEGLKRSQREGNSEQRYEKRGISFQRKVREGFLNLAKAEPSRFIVVDAGRNEKEVHDEIIEKLKPRLDAL